MYTLYTTLDERSVEALTYEALVEEAVQLIGDVCIYHEGDCAGCELKEFCASTKPMDYTVQDI